MKTIKLIHVKDIKPYPGMEPHTDSKFIKLFKLAITGKIPTYFAKIPIHLIQLFDQSFLPKTQPGREKAIRHHGYSIDQQEGPAVWVYPKDGMFILSDDYFAYQAYRATNAEFLPCFIMGNAPMTGLETVEGPLSREKVCNALGVVIAEDQS